MSQTPEEKAKELVEKFDESLNHLTSGTSGIEKYIYERAVSCALIAVNFAIDAINDCSVVAGYPLEEYNQIKEEIKKL